MLLADSGLKSVKSQTSSKLAMLTAPLRWSSTKTFELGFGHLLDGCGNDSAEADHVNSYLMSMISNCCWMGDPLPTQTPSKGPSHFWKSFLDPSKSIWQPLTTPLSLVMMATDPQLEISLMFSGTGSKLGFDQESYLHDVS